jgi:hypothetical protein
VRKAERVEKKPDSRPGDSGGPPKLSLKTTLLAWMWKTVSLQITQQAPAERFYGRKSHLGIFLSLVSRASVLNAFRMADVRPVVLHQGWNESQGKSLTIKLLKSEGRFLQRLAIAESISARKGRN